MLIVQAELRSWSKEPSISVIQNHRGLFLAHMTFAERVRLMAVPRLPQWGARAQKGLTSAIKYTNREMVPGTSTPSSLVGTSHMTPVPSSAGAAGAVTTNYHRLSALNNRKL